jgi:hypothetical protein
VPPQASYGRTGISGPFFATDLRTGNFSSAGAMEVVANGTVLGGNQQVARKVLVTFPSLIACDPANMLGIFGGDNDDSLPNTCIGAALAWFRRNNLPAIMVRYYDGTPLPDGFVERSSPTDWIGVQCYPRKHETTAETLARIQTCLTQVGGRRTVALVRALNTKFGSFQQVLDLQAPLCDLVRAHANIRGDLWFSHGRWYAGVESGAAFQAEYLAWEETLAPLFTGLP